MDSPQNSTEHVALGCQNSWQDHISRFPIGNQLTFFSDGEEEEGEKKGDQALPSQLEHLSVFESFSILDRDR